MGFLSLSPVTSLDPRRAKTIFRSWHRSGPGNAAEQGAADEGAGGEDAGRPPERGVVAVRERQPGEGVGRSTRKRVNGKPFRGFKSHLHRH